MTKDPISSNGVKVLILKETFPRFGKRSPSISLAISGYIHALKKTKHQVTTINVATNPNRAILFFNFAIACLKILPLSFSHEWLLLSNARGASFYKFFKNPFCKLAVPCYDLYSKEDIRSFSLNAKETSTLIKMREDKIRACNKADLVITASHASAQDIKKSCPNAKLSVIGNVVNNIGASSKVKNSQPVALKQNKNKLVLVVAALEARKNISVILDAFQLVQTKNISLVVVGSAKTPELSRRILELIESDKFYWIPQIQLQELTWLMTSAEFVICPSLFEGFGRVGLEAQSLSTPVLASDIPTHKEILGSGAQYVKDYSNPQTWANEIDKNLKDSSHLQSLIPAGKENIQRFNLQVIAQQIEQIFH